ncbi:hypothetical protein FJTKL_06327 [Diaporthe vaccinii]|uniref:Uncharacterized protein n=1 Tax=Diaporthe vaccinii TaxID=105482 RepID=A0ABR4DQE1_9PEZI
MLGSYDRNTPEEVKGILIRILDLRPSIRPKISASLKYKLKGLHDQHKIINYVDPSSGQRTYWPNYTRAWALNNWDDSMASTVDAVLRDNLIRHGTLNHLPSQAAPTPSAPRQVFGAYELLAISRVAE